MEMKLKYYLRGLGVGILITTFILSFGSKKEKLTDNEIIARARELGMVMKEENKDSLEELVGKTSDNNETDKNEADSSKDVENTGNSSDEADNQDDLPEEADENGNSSQETEDTSKSDEQDNNGDNPEKDKTSEGSSDETLKAVSDEVQNEDNKEDASGEEVSSGEKKKNEYVTFTITKGQSSRQVAEILYEVGLIDDVDDFNKYIIKRGKSKVILIGTYTMPKDVSYEEIVDIIT